jgi:hypothetical protein
MRTLFAVVAAGAVCAFAARNSDAYAAIGMALAFLALLLASLIGQASPFRKARIALWLVAVMLFWFAAIDRSVFIERCRGCDIHHFTDEYRLLGVSLIASKHNEHSDFFARIARDLGKPCVHEYERGHLVRLWGLLYPARPRIGITCCLDGGEDDYDTRLKPYLLEMAKQRPELAEEFHQRVLKEQDYEYLKELFADLPPD